MLLDQQIDGLFFTVLELQDGSYVEAGRATAGGRLDVTRPFPATLVPADWRDD